MSTWGDIHNHYYKNTTLSKLIIDHNSEFIRCFNDIKNDIIKSSQTDLLGSIIKTTIDLFNNKTYMFSDMATNIKYLNKNMWPMIIVCEYK
jgi:glutathionyl-hydroquinone reductase